MSVIDKEPRERGAHWLPDIVEELRADADAGIGWAASNLRRAADEIERLTRENDDLYDMLQDTNINLTKILKGRRALEGK